VVTLEEALDTLFTDGVADTGHLAALTAALGGLSRISCLGPYDATEGAIVCHAANSL